MTWQHCGPSTPSTALPAASQVTIQWQPAKGFVARDLTIVVPQDGVGDQDDVVVGTITIAGVTYSNSGWVPSTKYRPNANTLPGTPNFAGPYVPPNSTISITLFNTHPTEVLRATLSLGGPTAG